MDLRTFHRDRPFNDLPLLPPKAELETKRVLKAVIGARTVLAELKAAGAFIPNQRILIDVLGLQEAKLSSEIENIVTTNDELYRAFTDEARGADPQTKEVLSYQAALWHGFVAVTKHDRPLSTRLFEEIVAIVKGTNIGVRRVPGTKLANPSTGDVVYTPPEGERVLRDLLGNLETFIHADDTLDPLVRLAVMHYQFEAIHPFTDGNGRTGRILNLLFLIERKLLDIPVLYLSRYVLANRTAYYNGLRGVTEKSDWEAWIVYMLEGIEQTARATSQKIEAIRALVAEWISRAKRELPTIYTRELMELVFRHPYVRIQFLEQAGLGNRQTASRHLRALAKLGLLQPEQRGRETYYLNRPFLDLLVG